MAPRVVVTVKRTGGLDAEIDPRFGRAFAFLVVDVESGAVVSEIVNDAANAAHGAGTGAAAIMSDHGVTAVISGRFGPKACQALEALNIEMWTAPEGISATEALALLAKGGLPKMEIKRF